VGEGGLPVWSADGSRLYVNQDRGGPSGRSHHVYDVKTKKLTAVDLPPGHWIAGTSKDGKRLLSTWQTDDASRCCWVSADGKGEPEFITPEGEMAYGPLLSPDGGRLLFTSARKLPTGKWSSRLLVMDLKTKGRVTIDEPGETRGYCWSADGSAVAYTWQPTPVKGDEDGERTTWLITCDADGRNNKRVTSRRYKPAQPGLHVVIFFQVLAWC
jgi:Tol biopolymer transport system component